MLIYNITTKVDWSIAEKWLLWMQEIHMPEVLATGCFTKYQLVRILEVDEEEGPTYAVQYYAESKSLYNEYIRKYAPGFREEINNKWGDKYIAFRSLMELVD